MTNKEAIFCLKNLKHGRDYDEAVRMAIEALSELESVKEELRDVNKKLSRVLNSLCSEIKDGR